MAGRRTLLTAVVAGLALVGATTLPAAPETTAGASALCPGSAPCVAVDATANQGPAVRRADGVLHGISTKTSALRIEALRLRSWRGSGGRQQQMLVEAYTTDTTAILSDYWAAASYNPALGHAVAPWQNFGAYSNWVTSFVRTTKAQGWSPTYWDVQNEPEAGLDYHVARPSIAQSLQEFLVAYRAIKTADPSAKIIGPSLTGFTATPLPNNPGLLDLTTFLDFAVRNHLHFDAISWHETGAEHLPPPDRRPESIPAHVAQMRAMLAARPSLGSPQIFINEYMRPANIDLPGWRVAYIAALEAANVDEGDMSCPLPTAQNPGCMGGTLDGLLDQDGATARPAYWTQSDYASMIGSRVAASTAADPSADLSAFATASSGEGPVEILVGRDQSCVRAYNPLCPDPVNATPRPIWVNVNVRIGGPNRTALLEVQRLPGAAVSMPSAPPTVTQQIQVVDGVARAAIPTFSDGEAYYLTII